jgi:hypothetical protein
MGKDFLYEDEISGSIRRGKKKKQWRRERSGESSKVLWIQMRHGEKFRNEARGVSGERRDVRLALFRALIRTNHCECPEGKVSVFF